MAFAIPSWMDWRVASILAVITLSAYYILLKMFFSKGYDLRLLIPVVFMAALFGLAYFITVQKTIHFDTGALLLGCIALLVIGISAALSTYAVSVGPVGPVSAVLAFTVPLTVLLSFLLLHEGMSMTQVAGVALGLVSVYLISTG